jgi:hypothetical protein
MKADKHVRGLQQKCRNNFGHQENNENKGNKNDEIRDKNSRREIRTRCTRLSLKHPLGQDHFPLFAAQNVTPCRVSRCLAVSKNRADLASHECPLCRGENSLLMRPTRTKHRASPTVSPAMRIWIAGLASWRRSFWRLSSSLSRAISAARNAHIISYSFHSIHNHVFACLKRVTRKATREVL